MHYKLTASKLGVLSVLVGDVSRITLNDLSPTACAILFTLRHHGAMSASDLAAIAGITQPTAVRVTGGLIARGLVARGGRVGKTAPLHLTPAGEREAESVEQARLAALGRLLDPLDPDERAAFERTIDRLLAGATVSRRFARTTCRLCAHDICDGPACPVGTRATELERQDEQVGSPC